MIMMDTKFVIFIVLFASAVGFSSALTVLDEDPSTVSTYIVHLEKPAGLDDLKSWYTSFLPTSLLGWNEDPKRIVHSYRNVATGFAARLTAAEAKALSLMDGVVSARRENVYSLHTTHTPSFLGLHQNVGQWNGSSGLGKGIIIGVLDTGVFPDHPSFSDEGLPPPPAKWKGSCDFNGLLCNNKIIGAKNFVQDGSGPAPLDQEGHGTHTSSTAAGNFVKGAGALGQASGTAAGMAPLAHLAMYRVCGAKNCLESDILAAMDAAVGDGVDVLSLSLGGGSAPFYVDGVSIGAFAAIRKGIFVSCSAGNSGPNLVTMSNEAPWILTVGASTLDRKIKATAKLGNGAEYDGESLFQPAGFPSTLLLLVYAGSNGNQSSAFCSPGSLRNSSVEGKIVLCLRGGSTARIAKGQEVKDAGGVGMILMNDEGSGFSTLADAHVLPATHVSYSAGLEIQAYINSTSSPTATVLFKGTVIGDKTAPAMTSFSSRGPSMESPGILKPDITGPGVSILAAWPTALDNSTLTKANFNIISGTSMSCPHLSGIAALLKSSHPDWSPAVIKSAIMTTTDTLNLDKTAIIDETGQPADIFATGAGHVNPSRAQDPGLVYDIQPDDYIPYLCGLGYADKDIGTIVQKNVTCSGISSIPEAQLNYPSFSIILDSAPLNFTRTVTNVGPASSSYTYKIEAPEGVDVTVTPSTLKFTETGQTATYAVTFSKTGGSSGEFSQGAVTWSSGTYSVRSPIVVIFNN